MIDDDDDDDGQVPLTAFALRAVPAAPNTTGAEVLAWDCCCAVACSGHGLSVTSLNSS